MSDYNLEKEEVYKNCYLLKLNNGQYEFNFNQDILSILLEKKDVVDFVEFKKGHSAELVQLDNLNDVLFFNNITQSILKEKKFPTSLAQTIIEYNYSLNSDNGKIVNRKIDVNDTEVLKDLFEKVKECQKSTKTLALKKIYESDKYQIQDVVFFKSKFMNNESFNISTGHLNSYPNFEILDRKDITIGQIVKINDIEMELVSHKNVSEFKLLFKVGQNLEEFVANKDFIQIVLENAQIKKNLSRKSRP